MSTETSNHLQVSEDQNTATLDGVIYVAKKEPK